MPKDNVLTLKVPGANLVFTRYLYIKDEVKTALLLSILNKSDDAIFWAYELHYSGFKNELIDFIWQIYYDFFATLNPSFAVYLSKKLTNKEDIKEDRLISSIVQNLIIRSYNTDVFLLRTISELFISDAESNSDLETHLLNKDYRSLARYILNKQEKKEKEEKIEDIYKIVLNYYKLTNQQRLIKNLLIETTVSKKVVLLANILSLINENENENENQTNKKNKNFYVRVDPEEVVQYETIEATDNLKPYRILALACTRKIGDQPLINLFQSFRNKASLLKEKYDEWTSRAVLEKYNSNETWLYHASFSPLWFSRIQSHKGYIDYINPKVHFVSDEWEEAFHMKYGLEPDEQPLKVKDNTLKLTKDVANNNWQQFFAKYKRSGLIDPVDEEIDALNEEPLKYA